MNTVTIMPITTSDIITRFVNKHGDRYDYSQVNYVNSKECVLIVCKKHGSFSQLVDSHVRGRGCIKCSEEIYNHTQESMIVKFKSIHGDVYDYTKSIFQGVRLPVTITCSVHGDFSQRVYAHFQGNGCKHCADQVASKRHLDQASLLATFNSTHSDMYDYSLVSYKNARTKVSIICKKHGVFKQLPREHSGGKGCPSCKSSKGESTIRDLLNVHKISFKEQYPICKNPDTNFLLRVDFYIPAINTCIEYDGVQHFEPVQFWGGIEEFEKNQYRDTLKNEHCLSNNINLIRIPYFEFDKIETILSSLLINKVA